MTLRICPWVFGHDLCPPNARQPPLESSDRDGFVWASPLVVPAADWQTCTWSMSSWRFARTGLRESDLGISMRCVNSMSDDIVVFFEVALSLNKG